jgi:hypothetical protein
MILKPPRVGREAQLEDHPMPRVCLSPTNFSFTEQLKRDLPPHDCDSPFAQRVMPHQAKLYVKSSSVAKER